MRILNLSGFEKGWLIGDFEPSLKKTKEIEVGVKSYKAGQKTEKHYHKKASEYTILLAGEAEINGTRLSEGDIAEIFAGEESTFLALTDVKILVIKMPSEKGDKTYCEK